MNIDPNLRLLVGKSKIVSTVKRLAEEIRPDYRGKNPLLIGVLKGAFVFMADLIRYLEIPLELDFISLSSYGGGRDSTGQVRMVHDLTCCVENRHVILIEDIVDTGLTVAFLLKNLSQQQPASLKLCALLDKPSRRKSPGNIDYLGLTVPDQFLVGYGLDRDEKYRGLPAIYYVRDEK